MKNLFRIARWEFQVRFRSQSFFFNTFVSPIIFTAIIALPIFLFQYQQQIKTKLIGVIDLSGENITNDLRGELNRNFRNDNRSLIYTIYDVSPVNALAYQESLKELKEIESRRDSLTILYNQIKQQRTILYRNQKSTSRDRQLLSSYERMQSVREERELVDIELQRFNTVLDSLYKREAIKMADTLLISNNISAYLVFGPDFTKTGNVQYHSKNPGDFLEIGWFERILQGIITRHRMANDEIDRSKIRNWFRPIQIKTYQILPEGQKEWNFYIQFYGPLVAVFLLFMAIFTSSGYLFSSVLQEKANRVIEVILSYANSTQIMGGKILGLGFLGVLQILIWIGLTYVITQTGLIVEKEITYLTLTNGLFFLLYFVLGFLFYGAIFITIGSLSTNEYDTQQVSQLLRTIAIFPALLSLIVFSNPESTIIRILSYIPFLTPSFMIMRIPFSTDLLPFDIIVTSIIMILSIILVVLLAGKIFRTATLMQGKKVTMGEIWIWLRKN